MLECVSLLMKLVQGWTVARIYIAHGVDVKEGETLRTNVLMDNQTNVVIWKKIDKNESLLKYNYIIMYGRLLLNYNLILKWKWVIIEK